mmetsp:Transcript_22052/g.68443  ORF Transcript_22052/g.68443 Transcript_22052/m.68443 type:complete len:225 (-) Transcript_22052:1736-2410(-)
MGKIAAAVGQTEQGGDRGDRGARAAIPPGQRDDVDEPETEHRRNIGARPARGQDTPFVRLPVQAPHALEDAGVLVRGADGAERLDIFVAEVADLAAARGDADSQCSSETRARGSITKRKRGARCSRRVVAVRFHPVKRGDEVIAVVRGDHTTIFRNCRVHKAHQVADGIHAVSDRRANGGVRVRGVHRHDGDDASLEREAMSAGRVRARGEPRGPRSGRRAGRG